MEADPFYPKMIDTPSQSDLVMLQGYENPIFDAVLQVAPPAVLSPEGIRRAHAEAADLAVDMKGRRKRSVQSIIGR
jgi:hypothetical protein